MHSSLGNKSKTPSERKKEREREREREKDRRKNGRKEGRQGQLSGEKKIMYQPCVFAGRRSKGQWSLGSIIGFVTNVWELSPSGKKKKQQSVSGILA